MAGWHYTAAVAALVIRSDNNPNNNPYTPPHSNPHPYIVIAHCPRCFAMVSADKDGTGHGDLTWAHEQWHAATDYPIPEELLDQG